MGWQDRDWAKLDDGELDSIYGFRRPRGTLRISRGTVWAALVLCAVAVGAVASHGAFVHHGAQPSPYPNGIIFGIQGANVNGTKSACIEEAVASDTGRWFCLDWAIDLEGMPIAEPHAFPGSCAHVQADQQNGRWLCVSQNPAPSGSFPPAPQT